MPVSQGPSTALVLLTALIALPAAGWDPPLTYPPRVTSTTAHDPFPEFETLQGNVEFWTNVFGTWSLGQVVVHDMDYPGVVYGVVDLPGPRVQPYTEEQEEFIEDLREQWVDRLQLIERKLAHGRQLTDDEKRLGLLVTSKIGSDGLRHADQRVRTQRGLRERFLRGVEISHRYIAIIRRILREHDLPEDLAYMPHVESSFQAEARSSSGAVGIWQFTRGAGSQYLTINAAIDERLDPVEATRGAAAYLADAYQRLGDWPIAMTAYNHGVGGMAQAIKKHGRDYEKIYREYRGRTFGFASRNFYSEFLAAREVASHPEAYFPEGFRPEPALDHDALRLPRRATLSGISTTFGIEAAELARINPAWNRHVVDDGYALPAKTNVWLPAGSLDRLASNGEHPELPPAPEVPIGVHIVHRGETLSGIAARYGMRLDELYQINGFTPKKSLIHAGQKLRVASPHAPEIHEIRRGETLSDIARRYGMTVAALRDLNGLPNGDNLIHAGQRLRIREASPGRTHVVRDGETLSRIASNYRVGLADLLRANSLSLESPIFPGQRIRIPTR